MKKTTIASTLVAISFVLGTVAYAQTGVAVDRGATGDVNSTPKAPAAAKDTSMAGGSGKAVISPNAAGDVTSKPKGSAKAKDTSTTGYTGNNAPINPGAADDVTGKPTENGKTAARMSKNSKSAMRRTPPCTSTTASGTVCRQP